MPFSISKHFRVSLTICVIFIFPLTDYAYAQSSTEVQLHIGDGFKIGRNANPPTFDNTTRRQLVTFEHFSRDDTGDLFFFVDFFRDFDDAPGANGRESNLYGEFYYHLSGSEVGIDLREDGFLKSIDFGIGLNQGTDFTVGLIGPRMKVSLPQFRTLSLGVYAYHNVTDPFQRDLDTTFQATVIWDAPFQIRDQKFEAKGFVDFIGPQGSSVDNQLVFSPQLRWDFGHAIKQPVNRIHAGIEYTRFQNKFGNQNVNENSFSLFVAAKFS